MVLSSDTPARPKRFIKTELASNLRTSRTAAVEDVGDSVPQISLDAYFDHHLPQLPPTLSGDGFGTVLAKVLSCAYGQQRWNAFPKNPIQTNNEGLVFGGLIAIADTIRTTVSDLFPDLEPTTVFSNAPDNVPQSTWKTNATRPDGYLILRQRQSPGRPHWMDIAFPGEYKRSDKIEAQNDVSLLLLHILYPLTCFARTLRRRYGAYITSCATILGDGSSMLSPLRTKRCGFGMHPDRRYLSPTPSTSNRYVRTLIGRVLSSHCSISPAGTRKACSPVCVSHVRQTGRARLGPYDARCEGR